MIHDEAPPVLREETMLYREPTPDTDEKAVSDIWGRQLETRVVDSADVAALLAEGWVRHPMDLGKSGAPDGFEPVPRKAEKALGDALEAAERLVAEQERVIAELTQERDQARDDQKAAEELADAETKAKDAALAEIAALKEPKPPLSARPGKP